MDDKKKYLWFFGSAVQDVTVDVDVDRLAREHENLGQSLRVQQGIHIREGAWFTTNFGLQTFAVKLEFARKPDLRPKCAIKGLLHLPPGDKQTLAGIIKTDLTDVPKEALFLVPCDNLSWGGGGVNVATFARALAPNQQAVPLRYSDVAMDQPLSGVLTELEHLQRSAQEQYEFGYFGLDIAGKLVELREKNPVKAEQLICELAKKAAQESPDRSLDVYLASLPVDYLMYRPEDPKPRRNWVFSRVHAAGQPDMRNKIICKGHYKPLVCKPHKKKIQRLLRPDRARDNSNLDAPVGTIVLDSLKDRPFFQEAFEVALHAASEGKPLVILAMTEAMLEFTGWLRTQWDNRSNQFPELVFLFNAVEAWKFACKLGYNAEPITKEEHDTPNVRHFAEIAKAIQGKFSTQDITPPRIYVTLGAHGSLGVDATSGNVCYASHYPTEGVRIYDTNGCGDAYCAAISLLEWAVRNGYPDIGTSLGAGEPATRKADEMVYFMSVATATAYCKATNRRGRVLASAVRDLLTNVYLGSDLLPTPAGILKKEPSPCILTDGRLVDPPKARHQGITDDLDRLMARQ